jgi:hypothetical protein
MGEHHAGTANFSGTGNPPASPEPDPKEEEKD